MRQLEPLAQLGATEQSRVDSVVETLATFNHHGEGLAELAHDARNMVTALDLYCDLLQEPGVLASQFSHYGDELKLLAAASRRMVEKLVALNPIDASGDSSNGTNRVRPAIEEVVRSHRHQVGRWANLPAVPIENLAEELLANRNLLGALAGPTVALTVNVESGAKPVRLTSEDLTRIMVNLVKNAAEAMTSVGRIHITLWESVGEPGKAPGLILSVEDNGPGFSNKALETIFEPIPATRRGAGTTPGNWPTARRGLGLSITRSLVETAGGRIHASNRDPVGACIQIELPIRDTCGCGATAQEKACDNVPFN
jgi:signal transduction histidine kinase